jgi:GNAT superfamily N-acetyltransferase
VRVTLRPATTADLRRIAEIRIRAWQRAYQGLLPAEYLAGLDPDRDHERRRSRFADPANRMSEHVAVVDGAVVGWTSIGPYRGDDAPAPGPGEIAALYLDPDRWGRGVGRVLLRYAVEQLAVARLEPVLLWVLEGNGRARRFYQRCGFTADGARQPIALGGTELIEVRYRHPVAAPAAGRATA